PEAFGPHLYSKHWFLSAATVEDPFHLGDHPVVRENEFGSRSLIGLASPGIALYFPLSPTLCLCMLDPVVIQQIVDGRRESKRLAKRSTKLLRRTKNPALRDVLATEFR